MTSHDRVRRHTSAALNREIRERTERRIEELRDDPDGLRERLAELDAEWDIDRVLGLMASTLSLFGAAMASRQSRRWLALPLATQAFHLQHVTQGWSPPVPILRRLGFRTQREIERERYTLRALLRERIDVGISERCAEMPAKRID